MKKGESAAKLSLELSIATSTLSDWKRNATEILKSHSGIEPKSAKSTKRIWLSKDPVVDRCLIQWLKNMQSHQHPPSLSHGLAKARVNIFAREAGIPLADWNANNGLIQWWCKWQLILNSFSILKSVFLCSYSVKSNQMCGDANDCEDTLPWRGRHPTAIACWVWAQEDIQHRWDCLLLQSYALHNLCICWWKCYRWKTIKRSTYCAGLCQYRWEWEVDTHSCWQSQVTNSLEEVMQYCNTVMNGMMISFCYKTMKCTTNFFQAQCWIKNLIEWLHVQYFF